MSNFKTENIRSHQELFDLSEELQGIAEELKNAFNKASAIQDFRRSKIPLYKTIYLFFITNAMRQYPSIHILCVYGYAYCASPILRSLWENLVSIKYILLSDDGQLDETEANLKAKRFEEYRWVNMSKMLRYWKNDDGVQRKDLQEAIVSRNDEIIAKVNEFMKIYKTKHLNSWSGLSIEEMAKKLNMLGDYNLVYRMCCNLSHPSSLGLQLGVEKNPQTTIFSTKPSNDQVKSVLMIAIQYFHEFLVLHDHLFSLKMFNELTAFQKKARVVFESNKYQA